MIMKKILLIIGGVIVVLVFGMLVWRFSTPEDAWLCRSGKWVKHGNPNVAMPSEPCK